MMGGVWRCSDAYRGCFLPKDRVGERVASRRGNRGERQEGAEGTGQSDMAIASNANARERKERCTGDG
jgi:hypothetical protein